MGKVVEFDEEENEVFRSTVILGEQREPKMIKWLKDKGIVNSEVMAARLMVVVSVMMLVVAVFLLTEGRVFGVERGKTLSADAYVSVPGLSEPIFVPAGKTVEEVLNRGYEKK